MSTDACFRSSRADLLIGTILATVERMLEVDDWRGRSSDTNEADFGAIGRRRRRRFAREESHEAD